MNEMKCTSRRDDVSDEEKEVKEAGSRLGVP